MHLDVRSCNVRLSRELRDFIKRRLHFAVGRFVGRLGRVTTRLTAIEDPLGNKLTRCRIVVRLAGSGRVHVEVSSRDQAASSQCPSPLRMSKSASAE
jgi:hypothetical protein